MKIVALVATAFALHSALPSGLGTAGRTTHRLPAARSQKYSLIDSLRERLETAEAVARAKHNSGQSVEDKPRERTVIFNAVHQGVNIGLDADLVERVFAAQIEASKIAQRAFLKRWQSQPKFANVPNLAKTVRPTLDRLTPLILQGLKSHQAWPKNAFALGPRDSVYRDAWMKAIGSFK